MKPNQLLAFVAVAEQMSIRGAARVLGISQPAVTKIVRELERVVGAPLVARSVKGVELTAYGEAFAPRARLLLADMRRARDEIAQIRDGATGKISVAVSTFGGDHRPPSGVQGISHAPAGGRRAFQRSGADLDAFAHAQRQPRFRRGARGAGDA